MYWHHIWGNLIPRVLSYLAPKRTLGTRLHLGLVAILPGGLGYRNWPQLWPRGALGTFTILLQQIKWPLVHTLYSPTHFYIFFMRNASFFSNLSLQCRHFLCTRKCFAHKKVLCWTPNKRRKWDDSKGVGEGVGRETRKPSPPTFPSFALQSTLRVAISTLPNLPLS